MSGTLASPAASAQPPTTISLKLNWQHRYWYKTTRNVFDHQGVWHAREDLVVYTTSATGGRSIGDGERRWEDSDHSGECRGETDLHSMVGGGQGGARQIMYYKTRTYLNDPVMVRSTGCDINEVWSTYASFSIFCLTRRPVICRSADHRPPRGRQTDRCNLGIKFWVLWNYYD